MGFRNRSELVDEQKALKIFRHPKYVHEKCGEFLHDIGVIELNEPLVLNEKVKTIKLATDPSKLVANSICQIYGWGEVMRGTDADVLKKQDIRLLDTANFIISKEKKDLCPELTSKKFIWGGVAKHSAVCLVITT